MRYRISRSVPPAVMISLLLSCIFPRHALPGELSTWNSFRNDMIGNRAGYMDLYTRTTGEGDPIIFLHDFGVSMYTWRHIAPALADQHKVVLLDLKGFGNSPKPEDGRYSIYDQAALLCGFIKKRNLKNVTLVGHSFGGGVALASAMYLTENDKTVLKRLILIDPICYDQPLPDFIRALRTKVIGRLGLATLPSPTLVRSILKKAFAPENPIPEDSVIEYARALDMPGGKYSITQTAKQIVPPDIGEFSSKFGMIDVPTLLIWGTEDEIVPLEIGRRLHKAIPRSKMVTIGRCGHFPHEEKHEEVLPVIGSFLREAS